MDSQVRLHSLDAVRAFVLLLGIVLHATMSFIPGMGFPAKDSSPSTSLAVTFYVIHIFRMSAFFMIAGFFARMMFHRKGTAGFIKDRRKRILLPLVVGWAVFFPLTAVAVVWGLMRTSSQPTPPPAPDVFLYFPLAHFWFLYVLLWLYGLTLLGRRLFDAVVTRPEAARTRLDGVVRAVVCNHWAPLVLALPIGAYLYFLQPWPAWFGIPTPEHSLIPTLAAVIGFGTAFSFGWLLQRQVDLLQQWQRRWPAYLAAAIVLTIVCLSIAGPDTFMIQLAMGWVRFAYVACYTVAIWCWTFAIIGAAMHFFADESPVRRYIADSSYWLYLAHLPLVFFLQGTVAPWNLHWSVKFPLILAVATALLLLSYKHWVRPTYIGEVLNGRRHPGAAAGAAPAAEAKPHLSIVHTPSTEADGAVPITSHTEPRREEPLAALRGVHKRFGSVTALNGIDLDVRPGQLVAVLGPNGAGKSTAISLLLGLQEPDQGTATLFSHPPQSIEARRQVGVMMQDVTLAPELLVREHVDLVCSYYPAPYGVDEVIKLTRIEALAARPYGKLSGGQKRQVQFALALCGRPRLLFLDEPTVGLDVQAREAMWQMLRTLVNQGCSIVLTTHYLEEAEALADLVMVINKGKVIASGSVAEMRSLVSKRRVSCMTSVAEERVRAWPEVESVTRDKDRLHIITANAETVVRRLLATDEHLHELEVKRAGLSEAFTELTQEAA